MHRVNLFITCIADSLFPETGRATVRVLERLGVAVECPPGQTCCGQPAFNGGFRDEARRLARRCLDLFERSDLPVVIPSGSCAAMIRHGYPILFASDSRSLERAQNLAARTYEFSQFLVDQLGVSDAGARWSGPITYHPSCHLTRLLGVQDQPRRLLASAAGENFVPLPDASECCGFGGLFAIKHGDISAAIVQRKVDNIRASGAQTLTGCDLSCLLNIQGALARDGSPIRCRHLAEVLAGAPAAGEDGRRP